jgi:hypothetical protein
MGGEEEHGIATFLLKFLESRFDILGDSLIWRERNKRAEGGWRYCTSSRKCILLLLLQRPAKAEKKNAHGISYLISHISYADFRTSLGCVIPS